MFSICEFDNGAKSQSTKLKSEFRYAPVLTNDVQSMSSAFFSEYSCETIQNISYK